MDNHETEITIQLQQEKATNKLLHSIIESLKMSDKRKDRIILVLILSLVITALGFFTGFVWYESQFEKATTQTTEISTEGDNASAEYNNIEGNQYKDSSTHNDNGGN